MKTISPAEILTGDVIFCSSNTATGVFLKTFTSSNWNHAGIAIRVHRGKISLTSEGSLHLLEINSGYRYDILSSRYKKGSGLTEMATLYHKYNIMAVRKIRESLRTPLLAEKTQEFISLYNDKQFSSRPEAFIGVWLAVPLVEETRNEIFCTELMAHYFRFCFFPIVEQKLKRPADSYFRDLFGSQSPSMSCLFKPETFTCRATPDASIFQGQEELFYYHPSDVGVTITVQVIIALFIGILIASSLEWAIHTPS